MERTDLVFVASRTIALFQIVSVLSALWGMAGNVYLYAQTNSELTKFLPGSTHFELAAILSGSLAIAFRIILSVVFWRCSPIIQKLFER